MRGVLYACEWSNEPRAKTTALWVPDAGILYQWTDHGKHVQVSKPEQFPPASDRVVVVRLGTRGVSYPDIMATQNYLAQQKHLHAQKSVVQQAMNLITERAKLNEGRFQSVARTKIQTRFR